MNRAFTIIELLMVISIIALLLSILIPVLSKARYLAKSRVCENNLHQIATAIQMYVNDYQDVPKAYATESIIPAENLSTQIESYLGLPPPVVRERISPWYCPLDTDTWEIVPGSYYYCPFVYRQNYTLPPLTVFEYAPLIALMQDVRPRANGMMHIVRFDASAIEVNQSAYRPGLQWLQRYRRPQ